MSFPVSRQIFDWQRTLSSTGFHFAPFFYPVCERRVNLLVYNLSLHRHSYISFILAFASSIRNKQTLLSPGSASRDAEFVKTKTFTPAFQHNGIQDTFLPDTNISSHAKTPSSPHTLGAIDPKISRISSGLLFIINRASFVLKSLSSVFLSTSKPRSQTSPMVMKMEKLHGSDGRQTLRRRLTILLLHQDLVHGDLLQSLLLTLVILSPSC